MNGLDVEVLAARLNSSKVKDRNEGLAMMDQFIRTTHSLKASEVSRLQDPLIRIMDTEKTLFIKNANPATQTRLERASLLHRRLMELLPKKMKYRPVKECLEFISGRFFGYDGSIFIPLAPNFAKTLRALLSQARHRDHLKRDEWLMVTSTVLKALMDVLELRPNEKLCHDLLLSLRSLMIVPVTDSRDVYESLTEVINLYFKTLRKENSTTATMVEIVNQTLILFSTSNVQQGYDIVKLVVKAAGSMMSTNFGSLKEQFLVFGMLASEYISSDVAVRMTAEGKREFPDQTELRDDLLHWIDGLLTQLSKSTQNSLPLEAFRFYNAKSVPKSWFQYNTIGISDPSYAKLWMHVLTSVSLLNTLFTLESGSSQPAEQVWKRRKVDTESFVSSLESSYSVFDFTLKLISSSVAHIQIIGMQLLVFHIINFKTDTSCISVSDVMLYQKNELSPWVSLTIRSMLQHGWYLTGNEAHQILRINLQMIKETAVMDIACQLIIQILSPTSFVVTDRSINQLIRTLFEVPHVYGPDYISNDSMKFWMAISEHSKFLNAGDFRTGDMIISWIKSKISKATFQNTRTDYFPHFIVCLSEKDYPYAEEVALHNDVFSRVNQRWYHLGDLPSRILGTKLRRSKSSDAGRLTATKPPTGTFALEHVVDSVVSILDKCDPLEDAHVVSRLTRYGITIYQGIYATPQLNSASERLKYEIMRLLGSLYVTANTKDAVLEELCKIEIYNNGGVFVMESIKFENLLVEAEASPETGDNLLLLGDDFDDFGTVRRHRDNQGSSLYVLPSEVNCVSTAEEKIVKLILRLGTSFGDGSISPSSVRQVVDYLNTLESEHLCFGLLALVNYIELFRSKKVGDTLADLVAIIGNRLFRPYETERSPLSLTIIMKFCTLFVDELLDNSSTVGGFISIFQFLSAHVNGSGIYDDDSLALFTGLLLKVTANEKAESIEKEPDYDRRAIGIWGSKSNAVRAATLPAIVLYVSNLELPYQQVFVQRLLGEFTSQHSTAENAATLCVSLESLSRTSYSLLVSSLSTLFRNNNSLDFSKYAEASIIKIIEATGHNVSTIPETVKLEIFTAWYLDHNQFVNFPFKLLHYSDIREFVVANKQLLYAICKSSKRESPDATKFIAEYSGAEDEDDLELSSLSLTIPLSFSKHGIRSRAVKMFSEKFDKVLITYQCFLVVQRFIQFADVSKEQDFLKYIPGLKEDNDRNGLVSPNADVLYSFANISVNLSDVVHEIQQFDTNDLLWVAQVIHFIGQRLIADLADAIFVHDKVIALRRMKLLLILGHRGLSSDAPALPLIQSLTKYLLDPHLHKDTALLVEFILRHVPDLTTSSLYPDGLIQVYDAAAGYKESGHTLSKLLLLFLSSTYARIDASNPWKTLFTPYMDVLTSRDIRLSQSSLHEALIHVSQNVTTGMTQNLFRAMSLVFAKNPEKSILRYDFTTSEDVAKLLLKSRSLDMTNEVKTFIARYLGRHYLTTGDELESEIMDGLSKVQEDSTAYYGSLRALCDTLLRVKKTTDNLQECLMVEGVFARLMYDFNENEVQIEPLVDTPSHLAEPASLIVAYDAFTSSIIHPIIPQEWNLQAMVSFEIDANNSFHEWSQRIVLALIGRLKQILPWFESLTPYVQSFPNAGKKLLIPLWLFYVYEIPKEGTRDLFELIHSHLALNVAALGLNKLRLLVELSFLVRCCSFDNDGFRQLYNSLDMRNLYTASSEAGYHKFALVIFEEFMCPPSPRAPPFTLEQKATTLAKLYGGIGDADLYFGIPVDPSLDYALDLMTKTNEDSMRQVMFNSARFDSGICHGEIEAHRADLFSSLTRNSLNGLSSIVNDYADPAFKFESSYDWCWKLNRWDIAPPDNPGTEGEMIYTALKAMKEKNPPAVVQSLCQSMMIDALNSKTTGLMKTLCNITSIDDISRSSVYGMKKNIHTYTEATDKWFRFTQFDEYENLISARRIAFETMVDSTGEGEAILAAANEFSRFGKYSRLHGESQKAINATVLLDDMTKKCVSTPFAEVLRKVSNFETACTLWSQGQTFIPIAILMKDIKTVLDFGTQYFPLKALYLSDSFLQSYLVKWNSESRQKKFEGIMSEYVKPALESIDCVPSSKERAEAYHNIAYFCYKQLRTRMFEEDLQEKLGMLEAKIKEYNELKAILQNRKVRDNERKEAKRFSNKLSSQINTGREAYALLLNNKNQCLETAMLCLMKSISVSDEYDNENVDKLCGLWLQFANDDLANQLVEKHIRTIPTHKFIPWLNQLCSRLSNDKGSRFQVILQDLILDIGLKHPYHSLYFLVNLRAHRMYELAMADKSIASRAEAADSIWDKLKKHPTFDQNILQGVYELSTQSIRLATEKPKSRTLLLSNLNIGRFWVKSLPQLSVPLPTMNNLPVSLSGKYESVPRISAVRSEVAISPTGISLPKIVTVQLTDGSWHKMLLKGSTDDLRQDSIMEQVFEKVNLILKTNKESRKRKLHIRTYKVVPLGPEAGMIEFVADTTALGDILKAYHHKDKLKFDDARMMMKEVQQKSDSERLATYETIAKQTPPVFRNFFFRTFLNPDEWYKSRQIYTRGIVTTSIVGYILGLGDRHLNNILLDKKTGEPIHIDLGVAFDQGKLLPVPELVPFRLTRDVVDALGVTGVEGAFRKGSELVFKVLRENAEKIIGILDVLKYDPLYTWAISPIRRKRLQESTETENESTSFKIEESGSEAVTALKGVEEKLAAHGLSVEATVQELIHQATDPKNLAVIYLGWAPFY